MKLHLPKMLLAAVMAIFAIGGTAQAITVTTTYKETSSVYSTAESFNSNGYSYDATTGIITYNHTGAGTQQKLDTTITLNYTNLDALTEKSNLVYISTTDKGTWGTRATADGTIIGFLVDGADRANTNTYMPAETLATYANEEGMIEGMTVLIDATNQNGNGVQVKVPTTEGGMADVYKDNGLKYTPGTIVYVGIDKNLVSSITLKDLESTTVTAGSWSKTYTADEKLYNINSNVTIDGGASTSILPNLKAHGGDIIISGENGRLQLNTWAQSAANRGAISLDNDIYIGTSSAAGALRLEAYSGTINLNGTITLLEDSLITKEGNKENKNNMVTIGSSAPGSVAVTDGEGDNFTLTMKGDASGQKCDYITFAGSVDLGGLTLAGSGGSDMTFASTVQVGTLTTQDGAHKLTFDGDTELGALSMGAGSSLALAGTGAVSLGGGTLVGTITNSNANLSISGDIAYTGYEYTGNYSDGANGYMTDAITLIDNITEGDAPDATTGATTGSWNVLVDGVSCTSSIDTNGDVVVQFGEGDSGYYVTEELEYTGNVAAANDIVLKGGTLLLNSALKEGTTIYSNSTAPGTIKMGANQTLDNSSVSKAAGGVTTLTSADTTALYTVSGGNNTELNVTLGRDWTGTVKLTNVTMTGLDLNTYANGGNSSILFDNVSGYSMKGTNSFNMILADGKDALIFNNGNDNDGHTFTGKVSGSGNIVRQDNRGSHQYYKFTGDVSDWTGSFIGKNTGSAHESTIRFTENATTVNASVKQTGAATMNVIVANGEDVSMNGELTATAGNLTITKKKTEDDNGAETGEASNLTIATVSANGGNVVLNTTEGNTMAVTNLSVKSGNTITGSADLTVTNLTLGSTEAINMTGSLTLADGATINLTGLTLTEGTTTYTLATAANGVSLQNYTLTGLDLSGTAFADYTATIAAVNPNAAAGVITLAEGEVTNANTALVLTLTANKPETLTSLTINDGSYDAATGVLTFTTLENATGAVFGDTLNATMSEDVWAAIVGATTLPDEVLVSFEGADGELFDFDGDGTAQVPTITINGEGTKGAQVLEGDGTIVGGYVTSYIPEPTTTTLSLLALAGLAVRRRRASR